MSSTWHMITFDQWILNVIAGYEIEFDELPAQTFLPRPVSLSASEQHDLDLALEDFWHQKIIETCPPFEEDSFYSNLFITRKCDGSARVIINLKQLNESMDHIHFKMDTVRDAIQLMRPNCSFGSVDFKHAYFSVAVAQNFRKFLRFIWRGRHFQFTCLPQGLSSAPRVFTKLMKPVFSYLREKGHTIVGYIDDSLLVEDSPQELEQALREAVHLFDDLGLTVHLDKSVLHPVQEIEYLGVVLNSKSMTVSLSQRKKDKIVNLGLQLLDQKKVTVQDLSVFIGNVVAAEPAVLHAPLHYKSLEILKNETLKLSRGDFEAKLWLNDDARSDILWWIKNIQTSSRSVGSLGPQYEIESDASKKGWGGVFQNQSTGGHWSKLESSEHINCLELRAGLFTLQAFCSHLTDTHILMKMDNTTAVACVNKCGSTKIPLLTLTKELFVWAQDRNILLSATHIPGITNVGADLESRKQNFDTEWMLKKQYFMKICEIYNTPQIDLFASRINCQLPKYVAWKADPTAWAIDAFTVSWMEFDAYAFPPFSLLGRVLQKTEEEGGRMTLVAPVWPTRPWFPRLLKMVTDVPRLLPLRCLMLPQEPEMNHPIKSLRLAVYRLSGRPSESRAFRLQLSPSCSNHDVRGPDIHRTVASIL